MEVNSAAATSVGTLVNSLQPQSKQQPQTQPTAPKSDDKPQQQQDSAVVKLSERAKELSRTENQNNNTERAETKPKEAAEPSGIQFMTGETKGGRVDTFA